MRMAIFSFCRCKVRHLPKEDIGAFYKYKTCFMNYKAYFSIDPENTYPEG